MKMDINVWGRAEMCLNWKEAQNQKTQIPPTLASQIS